MEDPDYVPLVEIQHIQTESSVLSNLTTFPKCIMDVIQHSEVPLKSSQVKVKLIEGKKSRKYNFLDSTDINVQTPPMLSRLFHTKKLRRTGKITKYEYFMPNKKKRKKRKGKSLTYYLTKILRESEFMMTSHDIIDEIKSGSYQKFDLKRVSTELGCLHRRGLISRTRTDKLYEYYIQDELSDMEVEEEESDGDESMIPMVEEEESDGEEIIIPMRDIDDIIEEDHGIQLTPLPNPSSQDTVKFNEDLKKLQADAEVIRRENQSVSKVVEDLRPQFLQVAQEGIQKLQKMLEVQMKKTEEFSDNCDEWKQKYTNLKEEFEKVKNDQLRQLEELKETIKTLEERARENYQTLVKMKEERLIMEKAAKENSEKLKGFEEGREELMKKVEGFSEVRDRMQAENVLMENENSQLRTEVMGLGHEIDELKESVIQRDQEIENLRKLNEDLQNQQQPQVQQEIRLGKRKADPYQDLDEQQLPGVLLKRRKIAECENLLVEKVTQMERDGEIESLMRSAQVQSVCGEDKANLMIENVRDYRRAVDPLNAQLVQDIRPTLERIQSYTSERECDTCDSYSENFVTFPCGHTETKICMESCFGQFFRDNGDVWCRTCGRGYYGSMYEHNEN